MSAQRFTVERIEAARECIAKLRDSARTGVVIEFRQRDPLVLELHRALDAFALQTRQVEHMREVCELIASIYHHGNFKAETHNERTLEALLRQLGHWPYTPKDGGQ